MQLKPGTLLQGGKYRIEKVLGHGGFGITYLAEQIGLSRKVAVKEFFMKELCNRDDDTSYVSVPSVGSQTIVEKFRAKFIKEAQTIADMDNPHIVRIHDVFEENGTAYYVMEYLSGGSLSDRIPSGCLPESEAVGYIRQVAEALAYIHQHNILHLDVKPSNILFRKEDEAVLIDFGISKHYDDEGGSQTSSTPVGVSRGYAPLEQYKKGGVAQFSPATDVYSLGATLYKLLTGKTPPDADDIYEDGVPNLPSSVSFSVRKAVCQAMSPRRKDRPQSVEAFLALLDAGVEPVDVEFEETTVVQDVKPEVSEKPVLSESNDGYAVKPGFKWIWSLAAGLIVAVVALLLLLPSEPEDASYTNGILRVKGVEYPMVYVSGGSFDMGATPEQGSDAESDEKPVHRVTLSSYSIGKYEVTQDLWEAVMDSNPSRFKGLRRPVEQVSWKDCKNFIRKLNKLTGASFRLPTEAEWEFAARGGNSSRGYKYSGSDTLDNVAWYDDNSGGETHDVGTKSPNELGLYDMSGNVYEWCNDWYGSYSSSSQTNPKGVSSGSDRVRRGGSWNFYARYCRVSSRSLNTPDFRYINMGLRLCH